MSVKPYGCRHIFLDPVCFGLNIRFQCFIMLYKRTAYIFLVDPWSAIFKVRWWTDVIDWKDILVLYLFIMQHRQLWHLTQIHTIIITSASHSSAVCRLTVISIRHAHTHRCAHTHRRARAQVWFVSLHRGVKGRFSAALWQQNPTVGKSILNCPLKWTRLC